MSLLNAIAGGLFDLALLPFRQLQPLVGLAAISLATAVAMLIVFRATSDQRRLVRIKRQIRAAIFEIRLLNDDGRAVFRALGEILRHNLTYLRLTLVPAACMIVLLVPAIAQLQSHYGYDGLYPGRAVLVKAQLREAAPAAATTGTPIATLDAPAELDVQTAAVWIPATGEVIWRIAPEAAGEYELHVLVRDERVSKTLHVSGDVVRRSPVRLEPGVLNQLLYPAEPPLRDGGPVTALSVAYPERRIEIFGWSVHWLVTYVLLSMVWAAVLRRPFGVTL